MRTLITLFALTGCEIVLEPYPSNNGHSHDNHTHESHDSYETPQSSYGHGPVILSTDPYCGYDSMYSDYVWDFHADISHSYHASEIADVWVDVYDGIYLVYASDMLLIDFDPYSEVGEWATWTTEYYTDLYCDSYVQYTIETYAIDFDGNYTVQVDYI